MLISMRDLMSNTAQLNDRTCNVRNVLFATRARRIVGLVLSHALLPARYGVTVPAHRFARTGQTPDNIRCDLAFDELASAPFLTDAFVAQPSPRLIALHDPAGLMPAMDVMASQDGSRGAIDHFAEAVGTDIVGPDGWLGHVHDLLVSLETGALTGVVVRYGSRLTARKLLVPIERMRPRSELDSFFVLDVTSSQLSDAPQLQDANTVTEDMIDRLRSYFRAW